MAELKQELKLRGLTVSGTKNDLIERLKNFQEQHGGTSAPTSSKTNTHSTAAPVVGGDSSLYQLRDRGMVVASFPFVATAERGGAQVTAPQIMQFGSTSSSPPVSPAHSERSSTGLSPDETSCNGDAFGEMVNVFFYAFLPLAFRQMKMGNFWISESETCTKWHLQKTLHCVCNGRDK